MQVASKDAAQRNAFSTLRNILKTLSVILLVTLVAWVYQAIQPPPPRICGSVDGALVTSSGIKLKDGKHISYIEFGVSKEKVLLEELGVYMLSFDRPRYGESDPQPKFSEKNATFDIEELVDALKLGSKFHVIGDSMEGELIWSCLKFIPHSLELMTSLQDLHF